MTWHVAITLGDHSWDIDPSAGSVDDALLVLDSLSIGWALDGALWPVQPQPEVASFGLNVPNFPDLSDIGEGTTVAIVVQVVDDDPDPVTFYGRVTDLNATPRTKPRPGVTLSVTAVDYTADLAEAPRAFLDPFFIGAGQVTGVLFASAIFESIAGGALLDDEGDPPPGTPVLWTSDEDMLVPVPADLNQPGALLADILRQAIGDGTRMIVSPRVDPDTGLLITPRMFTLDTLDTGASFDSVMLDAPSTSNLQWRSVKGDVPTEITATYADSRTVDSHVDGAPTPYASENLSLRLVSGENGGDTAEDVVGFYLPAALSDPWGIDGPTWVLRDGVTTPFVDPDADPVTPPPVSNLFPRHAVGETDASRASCYVTPVRLTGIPAHRCPYGDVGDSDEIAVDGVLFGATLAISGRRLTVTPTLRRTTHGVLTP